MSGDRELAARCVLSVPRVTSSYVTWGHVVRVTPGEQLSPVCTGLLVLCPSFDFGSRFKFQDTQTYGGPAENLLHYLELFSRKSMPYFVRESYERII